MHVSVLTDHISQFAGLHVKGLPFQADIVFDQPYRMSLVCQPEDAQASTINYKK